MNNDTVNSFSDAEASFGHDVPEEGIVVSHVYIN